MSEGLALLDEALNLAAREHAALEEGEYEHAMELARQRGEMIGAAWNMYEPADNAQYRERVLRLSTWQEKLTVLATEARDAIRKSLQSSRLQKRRLNSYHLAVGQALQ